MTVWGICSCWGDRCDCRAPYTSMTGLRRPQQSETLHIRAEKEEANQRRSHVWKPVYSPCIWKKNRHRWVNHISLAKVLTLSNLLRRFLYFTCTTPLWTPRLSIPLHLTSFAHFCYSQRWLIRINQFQCCKWLANPNDKDNWLALYDSIQISETFDYINIQNPPREMLRLVFLDLLLRLYKYKGELHMVMESNWWAANGIQ